MAKHTPGPWRLSINGDTVHSEPMFPSAHDGTLCSAEIARVSGVNASCGPANARLIAAAPQLLDALAACVESLEAIPRYIEEEMAKAGRADLKFPDWGAWTHPANSLRMARAAIAAATEGAQS